MTAARDPKPSPEEIERAALFLTMEHTALQTGRSATVFEANGRVGLYLGALAGAVVALAFVGQAAGIATTFFAFGIAVLLPLLVVGVVTFTRVLQTGIEDWDYARRIERVRRFYVEVSPLAARYLDPPYDRSLPEAIGEMGLQRFRWQMALTTASMVAVVNGAVAGAVLVMVVAVRGGLSLGIGAGLGVITFLVSCGAQYLYVVRQWQAAEVDLETPE
jgi:hypothetical protein